MPVFRVSKTCFGHPVWRFQSMPHVGGQIIPCRLVSQKTCVCHLVNPWTEFLIAMPSSTRSRWRSDSGSVLAEFSYVPGSSWNTERCAPGDAAHVGRFTRLVTFAVSLRDLRGALSCVLKLKVWVLVWTQIVRRTATVASRSRNGCRPRLGVWAFTPRWLVPLSMFAGAVYRKYGKHVVPVATRGRCGGGPLQIRSGRNASSCQVAACLHVSC